MKRIYIIDSILNFLLAIFVFIPTLISIVSIEYANYRGGILLIVLIILTIVLSNFMLYVLMNNYSKKINYKIRKKLYRLIAVVSFLGTLLVELVILSII